MNKKFWILALVVSVIVVGALVDAIIMLAVKLDNANDQLRAVPVIEVDPNMGTVKIRFGNNYVSMVPVPENGMTTMDVVALREVYTVTISRTPNPYTGIASGMIRTRSDPAGDFKRANIFWGKKISVELAPFTEVALWR